MSNITKIPVDLINKIDREQIYEEFKERLSRLGDLKQARDEHEQRSWLARWFYKGEMEQAQLDAQLLQAEFAESLAKLMAINLIQSQQLEQQQHAIGLQQYKLSEQNEKLRAQAEALDEQHRRLKSQGDDLEKLVRDFFELKGLTESEARKLIAIAGEVKTAKKDIYERVGLFYRELLEEQAALKLSVENTVSESLIEQSNAFKAAESRFAVSYDALKASFAKHLEEIEERHRSIETRLGSQDDSISKLNLQLSQAIDEQDKLLQKRADDVNSSLATAEQRMDAHERRTILYIWSILGVAAFALIFSLVNLVATHRLFG